METLRAKLRARDAALEALEARHRALEAKVAASEGQSVAAEASSLNHQMLDAMRDVAAFVRSGGGSASSTPGSSRSLKKTPAETPRMNDDGDDATEGRTADDATPTLSSALKSGGALKSLARRGTYDSSTSADERAGVPTRRGGGKASGGAGTTGVTFLSDEDQARLTREGGYVAELADARRALAESARRLADAEDARRVAETGARVAKAACEEAEKRADALEEKVSSSSSLSNARTTRGAQQRGAAVDDPVVEARRSVRDALAMLAEAAGADVSVLFGSAKGVPRVTSSGSSGASSALAALPALAALANATGKDGRDVARRLTASGAASLATRAAALHSRDAGVGAAACKVLAALARGARARSSSDDDDFDPAASRATAITLAKASGGASAIAAALRAHRADAEACAAAANAAYEIAAVEAEAFSSSAVGGGDADYDRRRGIISPSASARGAPAIAALIAAGVPSALADAAAWHPLDEDVVAGAARFALALVAGGGGAASAAAAEARASGLAAVAARARAAGFRVGLERWPRLEGWLDECARVAAEGGSDGRLRSASEEGDARGYSANANASARGNIKTGSASSRRRGGGSRGDSDWGAAEVVKGEQRRIGSARSRRAADVQAEELYFDGLDDDQFDDKL